MNTLALLTLLLTAASPTLPTTADTAATADTILLLELTPVGMPVTSSRAFDALVSVAATRRLQTVPAASRPVLHTSDDLRALGDVSARRALVNCDEGSTSCLVEIAGALGARYVLAGTATKLGAETVVQLVLVDTLASKPIARSAAHAQAGDDVGQAIAVAVDEVLLPLAPHSARASPVGVVAGAAVTTVGVVAAAIGGGALAVFDGRLAPGSSATDDEKQQALALGWPAAGLAAAGVLTTVVGVSVLVVSLLTAESP